MRKNGYLGASGQEFSPRSQVASLDAPHAQYVIMRRSGKGSVFLGDQKMIFEIRPPLP